MHFDFFVCLINIGCMFCRKSGRKLKKKKESKQIKADMKHCDGKSFGWCKTVAIPTIILQSAQVFLLLFCFCIYSNINLYFGVVCRR